MHCKWPCFSFSSFSVLFTLFLVLFFWHLLLSLCVFLPFIFFHMIFVFVVFFFFCCKYLPIHRDEYNKIYYKRVVVFGVVGVFYINCGIERKIKFVMKNVCHKFVQKKKNKTKTTRNMKRIQVTPKLFGKKIYGPTISKLFES